MKMKKDQIIGAIIGTVLYMIFNLYRGTSIFDALITAIGSFIISIPLIMLINKFVK